MEGGKIEKETLSSSDSSDHMDDAPTPVSAYAPSRNEDLPLPRIEMLPNQNKLLNTTATIHSAMHGLTETTKTERDRKKEWGKSYSNLDIIANAPYIDLDTYHSDSVLSRKSGKNARDLASKNIDIGFSQAGNDKTAPEKERYESYGKKKDFSGKERYEDNGKRQGFEESGKRQGFSNNEKGKEEHPFSGREKHKNRRKGRRNRSSSTSSSESSLDSRTYSKKYDRESESQRLADNVTKLVLKNVAKLMDNKFQNKEIALILNKIPNNLTNGQLDIDRVQRHVKKLGKYPTLFTKNSSPIGFFSNFMYLQDRDIPFSNLSYIALVKQFFSTTVLEGMAKNSVHIHEFDDARNFVYAVIDVVSSKLLNERDFQLKLEKYVFTTADFENPKDCATNLCSIASQTGYDTNLQSTKVIDKMIAHYLPPEMCSIARSLKGDPRLNLHSIKSFANNYYYDILELNSRKKEKLGVRAVQYYPINEKEDGNESVFSTSTSQSQEKQNKKGGRKGMKKEKGDKEQKDVMLTVLNELKRIGDKTTPPPEIDYEKMASLLKKETPKVKAVQEMGVKNSPCQYCGRLSHGSERCIRHPDPIVAAQNQKIFDNILYERNKNSGQQGRNLKKYCILCCSSDHYSSTCGYYPRVTPVQDSCHICEESGMPNRKHPVSVCLLKQKN